MGLIRLERDNFQVTVIIPVYNVFKYLEKAVTSALQLGEVGEILLIEDGSTDGSYELCIKLSKEFRRVMVYQHSDYGNHGVGASRNLGIKKSSCDFVAFLDADDYYLPNRFEQDIEVFRRFRDADGVYNALGVYYYSENAKRRFMGAGYGYQEFLTLSQRISPIELIYVLLNQHSRSKGQFHTNTITVKKDVFSKVGVFKRMKRNEDTHLWLRLAAICKLYAGNIETPVAIRGVHGDNTMLNVLEGRHERLYWWEDLYQWFRKHVGDSKVMRAFEYQYISNKIQDLPKWQARRVFLFYIAKHPALLKEEYGFFDLKLFDTFGRNWCTLHLASAKNRLFRKMSSRAETHPV